MSPATAAQLREDVERYARIATSTLASPLERDLAVSNLLLAARKLIGLLPVPEVDHEAEWVRPTVLPPRPTVKP